MIRTLDFGIDFAIWSNLEDNYRCDTREKIGHTGGEIGEKNVTQENGIKIEFQSYRLPTSTKEATAYRPKVRKKKKI